MNYNETISQIVCASDLSTNEKVILSLIIHYAEHLKSVSMPLRLFERDASLSIVTIVHTLNSLQDKGLVSVTKNAQGRASSYIPNYVNIGKIIK